MVIQVMNWLPPAAAQFINLMKAGLEGGGSVKIDRTTILPREECRVAAGENSWLVTEGLIFTESGESPSYGPRSAGDSTGAGGGGTGKR